MSIHLGVCDTVLPRCILREIQADDRTKITVYRAGGRRWIHTNHEGEFEWPTASDWVPSIGLIHKAMLMTARAQIDVTNTIRQFAGPDGLWRGGWPPARMFAEVLHHVDGIDRDDFLLLELEGSRRGVSGWKMIPLVPQALEEHSRSGLHPSGQGGYVSHDLLDR